MFIVKLDETGEHIWSQVLAAPEGYLVGSSAATDADDNVYVTGSTGDTPGPDLGGGALSGGFLVKVNPSGEHVWSTSYGSSAYSRVALDPTGSVRVCGHFSDALKLGEHRLTSVDQHFDIFCAEFDNSGQTLDAASYGAAGFQHCDALTTGAPFGLLIAGHAQGTFEIGGGKVGGGEDYGLYIAKP